ncbi:hypothetical protein ACFLYO_03880 [Chloroflexota bacterium]
MTLVNSVFFISDFINLNFTLNGASKMPVQDGMGYSEFTNKKHEDFQTLLAVQMKVVKNIFNKYAYLENCYLYFDINPGDGSETGKSPVIAVDLLRGLQLPYTAIFTEREQSNAKKLSQHFGNDNNVIVEQGDHNTIIPRYIERPPACDSKGTTSYVYGSLYADPSGTEPPWELLQQFANQYPRIDLIVYLSATNYKRIRGEARTRGIQVPNLQDRIKDIAKKNWIIREPEGMHQWTFLIGTNWQSYPDYKRLGFVKLESKRGKAVFEKLVYTEREQHDRRQLSLGLNFGDDNNE